MGDLPLYAGYAGTDQPGAPSQVKRALAAGQLSRCTLEPHPGLVYDKFVDCLSLDDERRKGDYKEPFLKRFIGRPTGDMGLALLADYWRRTEELVAVRHGVLLEGVTATRLVSGIGATHPLDTGFTWHRTLGVPYLPGSSLKGLLSAWGRNSRGGYGMLSGDADGRAAELFGDLTDHGTGRLVILDVLPVGSYTLELDIMNPHYSPYYIQGAPPADVWAPKPIKFLTVAPGTRFRFAVLPRTRRVSAVDLRDAQALLEGALTVLGMGAKTATGYGLFKNLRVVPVEPVPSLQPTSLPSSSSSPSASSSSSPSLSASPLPRRDTGAVTVDPADDDEAIALYQQLDQFAEPEKLEAARRLQRYWQTHGQWDEWLKAANKPKLAKKYERIVKIRQILQEP